MKRICYRGGTSLKSDLFKYITSFFLLIILLMSGMDAKAASGPPTTHTSLDNNPYVIWSPDYKAWSIGDNSIGPYEDHFHAWNQDPSEGTGNMYTIYTGMTGTKVVAPTGYHIYKQEKASGAVMPVSKWCCCYVPCPCIHPGLYNPATGNHDELGVTWHGMTTTDVPCLRRHHNGWIGFCADCGETLDILIYTSDAAVNTIKTIPVGYDLFYACPYTVSYNSNGCVIGGHFEQATKFSHKCDAVSANKYSVRYNANYPTSSIPGYKGAGYTASTIHSYDNNMYYDGIRGQYATALRKNGYEFIGYKFTGWNTKADGTGTSYSDGQTVLNLTSVDNGTIQLYAQWTPCGSTLRINPNGGKFDGNAAIQSFPGVMNSTFNASASRVTPPQGVNISFVTNGGSACPTVRNTMKFTTWKSGALYGTLNASNVYTYPKKDSVVDTLTATYEYQAITLPTTTWANHSFSGWFYDAAFTKPAGSPGDQIVVTRDTVIYAQWAELVLKSVDDYSVYGGAGAVDLSWSQKDNNLKAYKLWQSTNGSTWTQLYSATETGHDPITVTSGKNAAGSTYTVTASGIYDIQVCGAQGGNYNGKSGGKGGQVDVRVYLKKGDTVTYYVGGQDGSLGGGSGNMGNGGGYSIVYINGSPIALAGGGGGANTGYDGGAGGLSTGTDASTNTGKSPTDGKGSGGGGGYAAGNAGTYILEVKSTRIVPLELTPGQIYTVTVDLYEYYNGQSENPHHIIFTPKYLVNPETREITYEYNNHGTGNPAIKNDHLTYNGNTYYIFFDGIKFDGTNMADPYNEPPDAPLWDSDRTGASLKLMYCGKTYYDGVADCVDSPGAFGVKFPGYPTTSHGVNSDWHANGHLWVGTSEEYTKVPASIDQAYGGSSHVYTDSHIVSSSMTAGSKTGNGSFSLKSVALGFQDDMYLNDVKAYDRARPDRIDINAMTAVQTGNTMRYTWNEPASNGTTYYHKAQSFQAGSNSVLCESNITENTLTSRITGYHYRLDRNSYGELSTSDAKQTGRSMNVTIQDYDQWLHIAAIDAAGNMGPAIHLRISKKPGPDDIITRWNLHTDQIGIEGTDGNVFHAHDKTWYVRADGKTPFKLYGNGTLEGSPYAGYAMNGYGFVSDSGSKNGGTYLEVDSNNDGPISNVDQWSDAVTVLDPYAGFGASYSGGRTVLSGNSLFTMADGYDGVAIKAWPRAYAKYMEELHELVKWSDNAADKNNGLILIGDARPPVIHGLDKLEGIDIIDKGGTPIVLDIWCEDSGSGVNGFTVTITNTDTGAVKTYEKGDEHLMLNVTGDDEIFIGNFTVKVDAKDNVGNKSSASANTDEFELTAWITRILSPHDPKFREGESGILHVKTLGFADRIEVSFPNGLEQYTQTIDYGGNREYEKNDEIQFMIPLYYLRDYFDGADHVDDVPLTVKAFKGDMELTATPKFSVFELSGSVLEEFRDRLK